MNNTLHVTEQSRQQRLQSWVQDYLQSRHMAGEKICLSPISGDAGFRSYYRVDGTSFACLAVDSPPATEKNQAFCQIADLLRQYGVHAPQIFSVDYDQGFMLLEDFGKDMYWPLLQYSQQYKLENHLTLYVDAIDVLLKMSSIPLTEANLPFYDEEKLQQEMDLFPQWFVSNLLEIEISHSEKNMIYAVNKKLINSALSQPKVFVHRDFHCRNLMMVADNNPGVIDFQDAVIGPITYDLVSLYRDCYILWSPAEIEKWVRDYYKTCIERKILNDIDEMTFMRWFDWMGLQRHIKVLGIFARLYLRDNKPGYLSDLPVVIHHTLSVSKKYEEFSDFVLWFEEKLFPKIKTADWYRELSP